MLSVSIISIVLCIIGIFLMSCDNQQKETEIISSIDYDYVGQYHNIGLNELLGKLNKTRSELGVINMGEVTPKERNEIIKDLAVEFVTERDVPQEVIDFTEVHLDKTLIIKENLDRVYVGAKDIFPIDFDKENSDLLTSKLEILNDIISDDDLDINSLLSRIIALENSSLSGLSDEDATVLFCTTATAKYSLQYWHENIDEQAELCGVPTRAGGSFNWKQVGKEDIKGGIAAAMGLGFTRFLGPIGWKAWLVGIAGGALGNSAADAVGQLIDIYLPD